MLADYTFLGILLATSSLIGGYMFIAAQLRPWLKMTASVVMVLLALWQWQVLQSRILGYPISVMVPEHSLLLSYTNDIKNLYVWVVPPGANEPRAYTFPFNSEMYKKLKEQTHNAHGNIFFGKIKDSEHMDDYDLKDEQLMSPKAAPEGDDE